MLALPRRRKPAWSWPGAKPAEKHPAHPQSESKRMFLGGTKFTEYSKFATQLKVELIKLHQSKLGQVATAGTAGTATGEAGAASSGSSPTPLTQTILHLLDQEEAHLNALYDAEDASMRWTKRDELTQELASLVHDTDFALKARPFRTEHKMIG